MQPGNLRIDCQPPGAELRIDGVPMGHCRDFGLERPITLKEGMRIVEVTHAGYLPYRVHVDPRGTRATLQVELKPQAGQGAKP